MTQLKNTDFTPEHEAAAREILAGPHFFNGANPAAWRDAIWPNHDIAEGLGQLPSLAACYDDPDKVTIAALQILCDECGMLDAIRAHGLHAVWTADLTDTSDIKPMPRYFFRRSQANVVEWMLEKGIFSPSDTACETPGISHLIDAVLNYKDLAVWLAEHGANFAAPGQDSVFFHLSRHGDEEQRIAQIALEQGLNPWKTDDQGRYPIELAIACGDAKYVSWLLQKAPALPDADTMRYFERLAKACGHAEALLAISQAAACAAERESLGSVAAPSAAAAGELAMQLIEQGVLSVNGKAPASFAEFEKLANEAIAKLPARPSGKPHASL